ncbi:MAG: flippase-like domain-containing protein [Caldisericia bacterium]|nr:flippase-like domain-containing protein [Caldisericia bacterium]
MNKKQWIGFFSALVFSLIGVLYLWNQAGSFNLLSVNWLWIFFVLILFVLLWLFDSAALYFILKSNNCYISIFLLFRITLCSFFFGSITPFQIGNIPALTVFLEKNNIPIEKGIPSILLKCTINGALRALISIVLAFYLKDTIEGGLSTTIFVVLLLYSFGAFFGYYLILCKNKTALALRLWTSSIFLWLGKKIPSTNETMCRINSSFINSPVTLDPLLKKKNWLIPTLTSIVLFWSILFSLPFFLIQALNLSAPFFDLFMLQAGYYMLQSFLPSPGGSGLAEISIGYIYTIFIGGNSPTFTFLLRFFTYYLPLSVGATFLFTNRKNFPVQKK